MREVWARALEVGAEGDGVASAVLLRLYKLARDDVAEELLFQVPESFSRLALEHKIRPTRHLRAVLSFGLAPSDLGGFQGLVLRLAADGHDNLQVVGPPKTLAYVTASQNIIRWKHPEINVTECSASGGSAARSHVFDETGHSNWVSEVVHHSDQALVQAYVYSPFSTSLGRIHQRVADRKTSDEEETGCINSSFQDDDGTEQQDDLFSALDKAFTGRGASQTSVLAILESRKGSSDEHKRRIGGHAFKDTNKALSSVRRRRMPATEDARHQVSVQLVCYEVYVRGLGRTVLFVSIPHAYYLEAGNFLPSIKKDHNVCLVYHFSRPDVLAHHAYQYWQESLGANVKHIHLHSEPKQRLGFLASARMCSRLHRCSPLAFPWQGVPPGSPHIDGRGHPVHVCSIGSDEAGVQLLWQSLHEAYPLGERDEPDMTPEEHEAKKERQKRAWQLLQVAAAEEDLQSAGAACVVHPISANRRAADALRLRLQPGPSARACDHVVGSHPVISTPGSLLFLGTGCAEPSKYRGSSGILLDIEGKGAILVEAGEGVVGQMRRHCGKRFPQLLRQGLKCVWISHKHCDHCCGLPALLSARAQEGATHPLLLVAPYAVWKWINDAGYAAASPCIFVHTSKFDVDPKCGPVLRHLGFEVWRSVLVQHSCRDAWGLILQHSDKWSLVYSGDTRPCESLRRAGLHATILVHEATFEDTYASHALKKAHTTVGEAMEMGRKMQAKYTILTHFSQRHMKSLELPEAPNSDRVVLALDGLCVSFAHIASMPQLSHAINEALASDLPLDSYVRGSS